MPLIPNIYHAFYKNLKDNQNEDASNDPDLSESDNYNVLYLIKLCCIKF